MSKIFKFTLGLLLFTTLAYANFTPPTEEYSDDANTVLLLHGNGTDGSTTITDSEATPKTVTAAGNAQIDTAIKKFGTGSIMCSGSLDYITSPDHADWDFGTGDFTIDFQLYFAAYPSANGYCNLSNGTYNERWRFFYFHEATKYLEMYVQGGRWSFNWAPSEATWYHVAIIRDGDNVMCFVDGTQVGSTGTGAAAKNVSGTSAVTFGEFSGATGTVHFDEYRISNVARDWITASGKQFIMITKFINNLNPDKIGTPMWSCKIKVMKWWKNFTWEFKV